MTFFTFEKPQRHIELKPISIELPTELTIVENYLTLRLDSKENALAELYKNWFETIRTLPRFNTQNKDACCYYALRVSLGFEGSAYMNDQAIRHLRKLLNCSAAQASRIYKAYDWGVSRTDREENISNIKNVLEL